MASVVKVVKGVTRNVDNVSSAYKSISNAVSSGLDLTSTLRKVDIGNYAKIFQKSVPTLKGSSGLVNTGKAVGKFAGAVPKSTDDLLSALSPAVLKKSNKLSGLADASSTLKPSALADLKSLNKLDNAASAITTTTKVEGLKGLARRSDTLLSNSSKYKALSRATPAAKKVDDVGDVLKSSKGVASKVDDVVDAGTKLAKKSSKKVDDVADGAKTLSKSKKALKFAKKWDIVANVAVMGGFYLGMYISNKINDGGQEDGEGPHDSLVADPASDAYPVTKYDDDDIVVADTDGEVTLMETVQRKEIVFAVIAAMAVVATI